MIYERIESNKRNSIILFAAFFAVVLLLGYVFGMLFSTGIFGIFIALLISGSMALASYYSGDKMALSINHAVPASKREYPHLINTIEGLSIAAGIPKPKAYVMDDPAINAFATGRDPTHASIAVTKGALEKLERDELEGVIGHEMSHVKNYDIRFMTIVAILVGIIAIISDFMMRSFFWGGRRRSRDDESGQAYIILALVGLVLAIITPIIAQLIKFAISRKREFLADADSALLTRYPKGLANALRKIEKDGKQMENASPALEHMYIANPFKKKNWFIGMFSTHPPIEERIKALEEM
ncbi:MAG: zinc metalloprotease HtpX [Candidatus Woesearchaeota archaeon]|nr:zinc metalloprotease HtpX [Candidatus Woesearchaeota archaeon]